MARDLEPIGRLHDSAKETKLYIGNSDDPLEWSFAELSAALFELGRSADLSEGNLDELRKRRIKNGISRRHCCFKRDNIEGITYLLDTSHFGTFVNEKLVGEGNSCRLQHGDLISLCDKKFYETKKIINDPFPLELTNQYLMSNFVIGKGAMGKVYIGKRRSHPSVTVAVKAIPKKHSSVIQGQQLNGSTLEVIKREAKILLSVKHPNCIHFERMFDSDTMAYIVMEYVEGGELYTRIVKRKNLGGFTESLTKFYAWQIFRALHYLHTNGIVHRDIKAENILLLKSDVYTIVKVADFGLSDRMEHSLRSFCGTKCYMAPEQWKSENYDCKVDIWALGVLIFTCLCGYQPFSTHYDDKTLKEQILQAEEALSEKWFKDPIVKAARHIVKRYAVSISSKHIS
ncbi:Serine/threonine-protein kinase chk-2 [Dirofilaria immitis]|nr:Serine/threonine-protein kinase chk-2 [Dirofilaria immitis]